jgi:hypothetical protein
MNPEMFPLVAIANDTRTPNDHVVVNTKAGRLECKHCGRTFGFALPMTLDEFVRLSNLFAAEHVSCEVPR